MSDDYQNPPQQPGGPNQPPYQGGASQQGNLNQAPQQRQEGNDPFDAAKHLAEQQIDSAIDQFAQKIPGGTAHAQQAKDAAEGLLDNLEKQAEEHMGDVGGMLGNLFGHHKDTQNKQG
jgi:hypothetical protein